MENNNSFETMSTQNDGYQVLIVNISWNKNSIKAFKGKKDNEDMPDSFTLDLPENVLVQAKKAKNDFNDVIESFCYNFLTRKFGHEVYHCQIWLPLDK